MQTRRRMFAGFAPLIRSLTDAELEEEVRRPDRLLLNSGTVGRRRIDIAYAPFDDCAPSARIVLVGLTPGRQQMRNALLEARRSLRDGRSEAEALAAAESFASFSGPMRAHLVAMLDSIGINDVLGVQSTSSLWNGDSRIAFTSVLSNPVFIDGKNYSGTPAMFSTPILREQLMTGFVPEVAALRHSIFVPLGTTVSQALEFAAAETGLDANRVLAGLPHPSGANAERIAFFLGRKPRKNLSNKVDPDRLITARKALKAKAARLANDSREHSEDR